MKQVDPKLRLISGPNVWNLAVIDNVDFKQSSSKYGNVYDYSRIISHATRMVFPLPIYYTHSLITRGKYLDIITLFLQKL